MLRKIVAGTLVLVIIGSTSAAYCNPEDMLSENLNEKVQVKVNTEQVNDSQKEIQIISPKISPLGEVIVDKNLLVSVQILSDTSVTLSVYKVLEESEELLFEPEVIQPRENLSYYSKLIKDIQPGNYKMVFEKENAEEPIEVVSFKVKKGEEFVEESANNISNILEWTSCSTTSQ